ncbi:hypothetical protein BD410DRAFT_253852 [Rickenella mellea]|uniref:Uncharacterized protein n=1 Tax=Rickenella mellea TaxID=50990 RepID=A0A4Y7QNS6_9AGAM|nr:hypothetical protein BD410DRAFT_253852 [Rickenella mellea]
MHSDEDETWPDSPATPARWAADTGKEDYLNAFEHKLGMTDNPKDVQDISESAVEDCDEIYTIHGAYNITNDDDAGFHLLYSPNHPPIDHKAIIGHENTLQFQIDTNRNSLDVLSPLGSAPPSRRSSMPAIDTPDISIATQITPDHRGRHNTEDDNENPCTPRVRFRSRVRIGSGLPHVSPSSSRSSSFSAPLRPGDDSQESLSHLAVAAYHSNSMMRNARARAQAVPLPIGALLDADVASAWLQRNVTRAKARAKARRASTGSIDERTPLTASGRRRAYMNSSFTDVDHDDHVIDEDSDREEHHDDSDDVQSARREAHEDTLYGKWPWRLTNRHWWWWKIEPIACYCCAESSEDEE